MATQRVGRAVVLGERALLQRVVVEPPQPLAAVVGQLGDVEPLARDQRDVGSHQGDVRVARADVAPHDRAGRVQDRVVDLLLQVGGQAVQVIDGDLQELRAAEIRPVPVRRRHLVERLFEEPRPDAVGRAVRVLVLQRDHAVQDCLGPFEPLGFAAVEQRHGVSERIAGAMDDAAFERRVVAGRRELRPEHLLGGVVVRVLLGQGPQEGLPLGLAGKQLGRKTRAR